MAAESLNLSKLAWVLFIWLCLDPPLQRFRGGFQCGLAATPQQLESPTSCVTGTGYCVPTEYLGVGVITHRRKTALEQVPCGHSLRELKKCFDNGLGLLGCLILVDPFQPRGFCDCML